METPSETPIEDTESEGRVMVKKKQSRRKLRLSVKYGKGASPTGSPSMIEGRDSEAIIIPKVLRRKTLFEQMEAAFAKTGTV